MVCSKCQEVKDFDADLFEGRETPPCKSCEVMDEARAVVGKRSHGVGCLCPRMVLYNEYNPDQDAIGAVSTSDLKSRPDAVIVVGTSLKVPGVKRIVAEMCKVTRGRKDGFTAWIGHDSEPSGSTFHDCWDGSPKCSLDPDVMAAMSLEEAPDQTMINGKQIPLAFAPTNPPGYDGSTFTSKQFGLTETITLIVTSTPTHTTTLTTTVAVPPTAKADCAYW